MTNNVRFSDEKMTYLQYALNTLNLKLDYLTS